MSTPLTTTSMKADAVAAEDVLDRVAEELRRVRELGGRIEPIIVGLAARPGVSADERQELQQVDLLLQHVDALQNYVAGLSVAARGKAALPIGAALSEVLLGDVRERLAGKAGEEVSAEEVELF